MVCDYHSKSLSIGGADEDNSRHMEQLLAGGPHPGAEGPDVARVDARRGDLFRTEMADEVSAVVSH